MATAEKGILIPEFDLDELAELLPYATSAEREELDQLVLEYANYHSKHRPTFSDFLKLYVWIIDERDDVEETIVKFCPYPWQEDLARFIPNRKLVKRLIILKGRQLGISWFIAAYFVWRWLYESATLYIMLSQTEEDAKKLLAKAKFIFDHLPSPLQPAGVKDSTQRLWNTAIGSTIEAITTTKRAGKGLTTRGVFGDEFAEHDYASDSLSAVEPTAEAGGQVILASTAVGLGNTFEKVWTYAVSAHGYVTTKPNKREEMHFGKRLDRAIQYIKRKEYMAIFLPYSCRPERDAEWWQEELESKPEGERWRVHQDYPRTAEEAFRKTGRTVFDYDNIQTHKASCIPPMPPEQWPLEFHVPKPGNISSFNRNAFSLYRLGRDFEETDSGLLLPSYAQQLNEYEEWPEAPVDQWKKGELKVWELPDYSHRYCAGADVSEGLVHGDYDYLTVFDRDTRREVLTLHGHWTPKNFAKLIDRIARVYPGLYGVERNVYGYSTLVHMVELGTPGIYREHQLLNKLGKKVHDGKPGWYTSVVTKPTMITELVNVLSEFQIELADIGSITELTNYRRKDDGTTSAPDGQFDDRVMALSIVVQMLKRISDEPDSMQIEGIEQPISPYDRRW